MEAKDYKWGSVDFLETLVLLHDPISEDFSTHARLVAGADQMDVGRLDYELVHSKWTHAVRHEMLRMSFCGVDVSMAPHGIRNTLGCLRTLECRSAEWHGIYSVKRAWWNPVGGRSYSCVDGVLPSPVQFRNRLLRRPLDVGEEAAYRGTTLFMLSRADPNKDGGFWPILSKTNGPEIGQLTLGEFAVILALSFREYFHGYPGWVP